MKLLVEVACVLSLIIIFDSVATVATLSEKVIFALSLSTLVGTMIMQIDK